MAGFFGSPLEVLQNQVNGQSRLLFQLPASKMHVIRCPQIEDISDIKLIRTIGYLILAKSREVMRLFLTVANIYLNEQMLKNGSYFSAIVTTANPTPMFL